MNSATMQLLFNYCFAQFFYISPNIILHILLCLVRKN
jgi:hypothetical protein